MFSGAIQLSHQAISIAQQEEAYWPRHSAFKTWDSTLVLDGSQFVDAKWLALDIWLFESSSFFEVDRQIKELAGRYKNFRMLAAFYQQLTFYPLLSLGIVFRAASDPAEPDA